MSPNSKGRENSNQMEDITLPHNELKVELIHLEPFVKLKKRNSIGGDTLENLSRREVPLKNKLCSKLKEEFGSLKTELRILKKSQKNSLNSSVFYYEDEGLSSYEGTITLDRLSSAHVALKVANFCKSEKTTVDWLSLADSCFDCLFPPELRSCHPLQPIKSFGFGSLIDMSKFISHFSSNPKEIKGKKESLQMRIAQDDIRGDFLHDQNKLFLFFRTTSGIEKGTRSSPKSHCYKLVYDYSSITSMVLNVKKDIIVAYFILNCPPLLYKREQDFKEVCYKNHKHDWRCLSEDESKGRKCFHVSEIGPCEPFLRVTEFEGVNADTIGKCNVLRFEIDQIKKEEYYEQRPDRCRPCPWSVFSGKRIDKRAISYS